MLARFLSVLLAVVVASPAGQGRADDRRLVLLLVVDQLRGEMPIALADRFGDGGFRRFLDRGVYYANANYRHSTTFTAVGHATIVTGAAPSRHGIVGNDWYEAERGRVYSTGDERHQLLTDHPPSAPYGTSPANLLATTVGDELVMASGARSRVFSVSIKDRAAILMGGRLGDAWWYDKSTGGFLTSTYYRDAYPAWVAAFNEARGSDRLLGAEWTLSGERDSYRSESRGDARFDHRLANEPTSLYGGIPSTPFGDQRTVEFAKRLMDAEEVGQRAAIDVLAVSLSSTDYIGHAYGPDSLEYEDNLLRLDRTVADLLDFVDDRVGLDRTLVVLTSDHGIGVGPASLSRTLGARDPEGAAHTMAGAHNSGEMIDWLNRELRDRYGALDEDPVTTYWMPCFYLDHAAIERASLAVEDIETWVAAALEREQGVYRVYRRSDLLRGRGVGDDALDAMVRRAFHPERSGDLVVITDPGWFIHPKPRAYTAMHGSPWRYDTHVPIAFLGHRVPTKRVHRQVGPEDIAPTLAAWLGIPPPPLSDGEVLTEVLNSQ